ncbi:MAG: response regulator [Phycisphaeraceae bacterium]
MNECEVVKTVTVLMADDDPEDRLMTERAFKQSRVVNDLRFVEDGQELMDYLYRAGRYAESAAAPRPGLILLDLNMPRKNGRQALAEIKSNPDLRCIPVVVLTTSRDEQDVLESYNLGVNSYITKPVTFQGLVEAIGVFGRYWLEIVELPPEKSRMTP